MTYKTVVIAYSPNAEHMAASIEAKANEMAAKGYTLVSATINGAAKGILVFSIEE